VSRIELKLANKDDAYFFHKGRCYVLDNNTWRLERWTDRLRFWLRRKLRLDVVQHCIGVQPERGMITFVTMKWSWLRLRWERV
jgi:hypothetical protein